ncbi:MAG: zinc-binding dehydrogenase, partial [Thermoprotei archaeon]
DQIIAIDIVDRKLKWAREFGATDIINAKENDPVKAIRDLTGGTGVDIAFEVVGNPNTISQAVESVKVGGRVVLVGLMPVGTTAPINAARVVRSGIQILGSYGGRPRIASSEIFNLIKKGLIKVDEQITKKWKLEEINEALIALTQGEVIRSIVTPR